MIELPKTGDPVGDRFVFGVERLKGDMGIRYFDASIAYGHGAAHSVLARLIDGVPADNLHMATKIGHFHDGFPQARRRSGDWSTSAAGRSSGRSISCRFTKPI